MTIGWGVIGAGKLADVAVVPNITKNPDSRLAAVYSRDLGRARAFVERHGDGAPYDDYAKMLAAPGVDVVYVATPNAMHRDHTIQALKAGKHVLVEKPMALSLADGREMVSVAKELGLKLAVGFHLRHKESNRVARQMVAEGRLGDLFLVEMAMGASKATYPYDTWRAAPELSGGGTLLNQGTHVIDLVRYLTGQRTVRVSATVDRQPIEEVFAALLTLENGTIASVSSHQYYLGARMDYVVNGASGWVQGKGTLEPRANDELLVHDANGDATIAGSDRHAHSHLVESFVQAVLGRAPVNGDGEDGLHNIAVVDAIYRSARTGHTVEVEPIW